MSFENNNSRDVLDDLPIQNVYSSGKRHLDVSSNELSERWFISPKQAIKTLRKTAQKFLRSAILPLSRRYRADRYRKALAGKWYTDTMDGSVLSLDCNRYAQVISKNHGYFAKLYPMDSKGKADDTLRTFAVNLGYLKS